ncbi:hypothetical protein H2248_008984 [Termitomyces sp. 'cryptogamus']|nr:hypothetical protein H2248_008984 [Termitomyces sp. 'cryptogamus']
MLAANALQYGNPSVDVIGTLRSRHAYLVNLTMGITSDLMISASLVYILNAMRTGFKSTENVINRLLVFSMSNGLLTTIISSLILVTYYVEPPPSLLATVFIHISGKLYVNSMLVTYINMIPVHEGYLFYESTGSTLVQAFRKCLKILRPMI